jgi:protein required for attachment to host cells
MRVRVIVADQSEARFYDMSGTDAQLQPAGRMVDPDAAAHEQELAAERGGAAYGRSVVADTARKLAFGPRSAAAEPRPRKDAAMRFARQIAAALDAAYRREGFDRSVLVAGPTFIGLLRSALSEPVRATLVAEVRKDLIHQDDETVQAYVPPDAFQ